jgi:hypothetical protein
MNEKQLENKVRQDAERVKKDFSNLVEARVAQFNDGFDQLTHEAKESVVGAAATVKKGVGDKLSQFNAKAQEVAEKVPGGLSAKAVKYPWVAMSIVLVIGFVVGSMLRPARHILG